MPTDRPGHGVIPLGGLILLLAGCAEDGSHAPAAQPQVPLEEQRLEESGNLAPLDLVYVCGNKFLATNSTRAAVHLTYRVVGTSETGGITLPPGPIEDPGHSETELETTHPGIVELSRDGERVVRRRNLKTACGAPALASLAAGSAAEAGSWTDPFPWPSVAIHLSLLPTGRVLSWGLIGEPVTWDPLSGEFTEVPSQAELFCSGHSLLSDGRVLVAGGHIASDRGIADISIFSPSTGAWTRSTPMRRGRWYPTNTTLPNGSVVILAGRDEVGDEVAEPEVWSPGGIRQLSNASLVLPYYPRTFVAPNGLVFYAGEQQTSRYLSTSGNGSWTTVGSRRYGARSYGAAVMYELGKILYVGGGRTTNTAEIIDLGSAAPTWRWTGSMAFARRNLNATVLPTGEVLVTGGSSHPSFNDVTQAVRAAEIWNPATGLWTTVASNAVSRTYHSTSLLLPDGRVLHTGSGEGADMPEERNAEIYSPPYLSRGPRPVVTDAPELVGWGTTFRVETPDAADIAKVSLIRLGSVTHAFDMNQRFQWLPFAAEPSALTVSAPANGAQAPPGHYMVFLVSQSGVPSVGRIVKISGVSEPTPGPNAAPVAAFLAGCGGQNCTFADRSTDPDGNLSSWHWSFGDGEETTARDPSHAYQTAGTYTVRLTARDTDGEISSKVKQVTVPGPQFPLGLTFTTSTEPGKQIVTLSWTRAQGPSLYVYRNGLVLLSTPNDGKQKFTKNETDPTTYIFKICEAGTTICSNPVTAQFGGGSSPDNSPPNAAFTPTCTVASCRFADGSTDPDGTVIGWEWDFGDGSSSTQRNPTHAYAEQGDYRVRLTVTDNRGGRGSSSRDISVEEPVNVPPTANLTWNCTGLDCVFSDASSDLDGSLTIWQWDFGDGSTADVQNPSHTFGADGTYAVGLTVTDNDGSTASVSKQVTVSTPGPNADPLANFSSSCGGLTCAFTDLSTDSDGAVTGWSWSFGDGGTSTIRNPSRTYAAGGLYTVTLTVTDNAGGTHQHSATVTVSAPPPPTITLTVSGFTSETKHSIRHNWSGAAGTKVDIYRNGVRVVTTANDGHQVTGFEATGTATYLAKVCQAGTAVCSAEMSLTLSN
jgi:PKD repeat protein